MGDAYGRRNFHRPQRQEWMNSPQYFTPNVEPFVMTSGTYVPPGMVRSTNMGPPMIPSAFQHQPPFTLPPPGNNANLVFQPSHENRGGFATNETHFSNFPNPDASSFSVQTHGFATPTTSEADGPALSPKSAGLIRIPYTNSQNSASSNKDEKKNDRKTKDKEKHPIDGNMTFSRFKRESKLDGENLAYILEDTRMSTLQRKLSRESNTVIAFGLTLQISEVILYHENRGYVYRSSEIICDAIKEVILGSKSGASGSVVVNHCDSVKTESAKAMGRVLFVLYDGKASDESAGKKRNNQESSFEQLYSWIWKQYRQCRKDNPRASAYFLKCFESFFALKPFVINEIEANRICKDLQEELEDTENQFCMVALVDVFMVVSQNRPQTFNSRFQDIVDILVGWHIDSSQKLGIRNYTSDILLRWHSYWIKDMEFSTNLLKQFIEDLNEDLDTLKADICGTNGSIDSDSYRDNINHALSIVQVFNTVLSCIKWLPHETKIVLDEESLSWFDTVMKCVLVATEGVDDCKFNDPTETSKVVQGEFEEDIIIAGLQSIPLLIEMCPNASSEKDDVLNVATLYTAKSTELSQLLKFILHYFLNFSYQGQVCVLNYCLQMQSLAMEFTNQELNIDEKIVKEILSSGVILNAAFSSSSKVQKQTSYFVRQLLKSKNIIILQEVYSHLTEIYESALVSLADIDPFLKKTKMNDKSTTQNERIESKTATTNVSQLQENLLKREAETLIHFTLNCLSDLINAKGSVLSMWALDPSLFTLLVNHSGLLEKKHKFYRRSPWIYETLIKTLIAHCTSHNQFATSSNIISSINMMSHSSPTVNYFESILESAASLLHGVPKQKYFSNASLSLAIIDWVSNIFEEAKKFEHQLHAREVQESLHGVVLANEKFRALFFAVIDMSCKEYLHQELVIACLRLVKSILMDFPLIGLHTKEVSEMIRECGVFHLKAVNTNVKELACEILGLIPPMVGNWVSGNDGRQCSNSKEKSSPPRIEEIHNIKMAFVRSNHESIKPTDFKVLIDTLLNGPRSKLISSQTKIIKHLESYIQSTEKGLEYDDPKNIEECIASNSDLQSFWISYQLAQFCVNGKLKTPLGKAQETLTTIEKVIRQLTTNAAAASIQKTTNLSENSPELDLKESFIFNVNECRRLLIFFELLEKTMANAWDGSAYYWANPSGGKPIISFFTANKRTCLDWLSRLRVTVVQLAYYVGEYGFAARNAFIALENLQITKKGNGNGNKNESAGINANNSITMNPNEEVQFVHIIVLTALSLYKLRSSQYLHGLYTWCKENTGKKLRWISPLIDFVKHRVESGIHGFQASLMHPAVLDSASYGDPTSGGAITYLAKEAYMFHAFLHEQMDPSSQMAAYEAQAEKYRQKVVQSCSAPQTQEYLHALSNFDNGVVLASYNDDQASSTGSRIQSCFRTDDILIHSHQLLLKSASCLQNGYGKLPSWKDSGKLPNLLKKAEEQLNKLLTDHRLIKDQFQQVLILKGIHNELTALVQKKSGKLGRFLSLVDARNDKNRFPPTSQLILIKKWGEFFTQFRKNNPKFHFQLNSLNLEIAIVARKERNFRMASSYLRKLLIGPNPEITLKDYMKQLDLTSSLLSVERASSLRQAAKLIHVLGDGDAGLLSVQTLCGIATSIYTTYSYQYQQGQGTDSSMTELLEISSRSLNTMAKWLKNEPILFEQVYPDMISAFSDRSTVAHVLQLEQSSPAPTIQDFLSNSNTIIPGQNNSTVETDLIIGRLIRLAVVQAPHIAKIWNNLANWSLEVGEKNLSSCNSNTIELTFEEKEEISSIIHLRAQDENLRIENTHLPYQNSEINEVLGLISQIKSKQSRSDYGGTGKNEWMKRALKDCKILNNAQNSLLDGLQLIWEKVQKRFFFYHETAVNAYFQFLSKTDNRQSEKVVTATLRLLQLTVHHAVELQECLQKGLESTPSSKWRAIIPQLFSRLNHPIMIVRNRISELLCRIANDYPHLIIYPAIVGSVSTADSDKFSNLLSTVVNDENDGSDPKNKEMQQLATFSNVDKLEKEKEDEVVPELRSAHAKIVDFIVKQRSGIGQKSVEQVQNVVCELQRISVLWDELWLGTLQQYGNEINRRVKKMEDELHRLEKNNTLTENEKTRLVREKYNIIFKPIIYVLEKVVDITCRSEPAPETLHERSFSLKYGEFLANTIPKLKEPAQPSKPKDVWGILNQFQQSLSNRVNKKHQLKMSEISTILSKMKATYVPMPGNDCNSGKELLIDSFEDPITILPTKTKPKRISVIANDGRRYTYLFKGLEDLHLDERIMQFLKVANIMMMKRGKGDYSARHYSVVPLGPRSGLIQWVEGTIPLYSLYKRWQQRQQNNDAAAKKTQETTSTPTAYQKPSEAFYAKLVPLLRDHGITNLDNRKEWPLEIMNRVYQILAAETPNNLLSQEIWFASDDSEQWFKMTENITRSIAVMSVIGYVIGLGDRHLDNLLVDLKSGEIIHIDYNCCFEKGKNLRIPERVPCRLTQNIVNSFGLTGVDGVFRLSCEHVLDTMRSGRETLLTLLEAFVYDPLVDWTPGIELGFAGAYQGGGRQNLLVGQDMAQDKRDMQTEITFSMLSVRISEIRGPWLENQGHILTALAGVEDGLNLWLDETVNIHQLNDYLTKLHHGMSILKEAEANPRHRLYSLQDRYVEHKMVEQAVLIAQEKAFKFIEEYEKRMHLHQRASEFALTPLQIRKWTTEVADIKVVNTGGETGLASTKTSDIVKTFLENAGQNSLMEQLQGVENVFGKGLEKLKSDLQTCLLLLGSYATVTSLFPQSYKSEHRNNLYVKWMREVTENNNMETCHQVLAAFTAQFADNGLEATRIKQHHILNLNYQLESWTQEINFRLQNIYERILKEGINYQTGSTAILQGISKSRSDLQRYLQNEKCKTVYSILSGIAATKMAEIVKKVVTLESTIHFNGGEGQFVDLSNSDWFLFDEILMEIGFGSQFLDTLDFLGLFSETTNDDSMSSLLKCYNHFHHAVKQLQNLNSNFFAVILQEGLKCFLREDPSIITVALELNKIVSSVGISVEEAIEELDVQIRYCISNMELSNDTSSVVAVSKALRSQYQLMIKKLSETGTSKGELNEKISSTTIEQGKMLFLAFNSLFDSVDSSVKEVRTSLKSCQVPETWSVGIDSIADSHSILAQYLKNDDVEELVELWIFMNRLHVLKEYFAMCLRSSTCFKAGNTAIIGALFPSGDEMARPLKVYVTEYFRRFMLGLSSLCLSSIACTFVNIFEPNLLTNLPDANSGPTKLSISELTKAYADKKLTLPGKDRAHFLTLEIENLCANISKLEIAKLLEHNIEALNASQKVSQLQRSSFQWFHEIHLPLDAITLATPIRAPLIADLQNYMTMVLLLQENLTNQQTKYQEYHSTVEQRMRWACGANPDLQDIFDAYSTSFSTEMEALRRLITISKSVCGTISTVCNHEALRTQTADSVASDSAFVALVSEFQNAITLKTAQTQNQTLTEQELSLFSMNPPKEILPSTPSSHLDRAMVDFTIDRNWILQTEESIASRVKTVQNDLVQENQRLSNALSGLHQSVTIDLKRAINVHQKLMADVGALLKAIDKSPEAGGETDYEVPEIQHYLVQYRIFSDLLSNIMHELTRSDDLTEEKARYLTRNLEKLKEVICPIYEDLVEFSTLLREDNIEKYKKARKEEMGNGFVTNVLNAAGPNAKKPTSSCLNGAVNNVTEEKNTFALNVLRRVRAKLEGREPDVLRRSSVAEQVDFIIREATSLDNLSLLYEGWTSWI